MTNKIFARCFAWQRKNDNKIFTTKIGVYLIFACHFFLLNPKFMFDIFMILLLPGVKKKFETHL